MYPGKALQGLSQGREGSSYVEGDRVTLKTPLDNPTEFVMTRSDAMKVRRKAGRHDGKGDGDGTLKKVEEKMQKGEEKEKDWQDDEEPVSRPGAMDVLQDFCTKTTAHGFNHIVKTGQPLLLRLFWFLVTALGILMLISASYEVTHSTLIAQRPSIEIIYHDLYSSGMRLPFMTICSLAGFWKSKLEQHNVSVTLASYLLLAVRGTDIISPAFETNIGKKTILKETLDNYLQDHNLTLSEMVTLLSPTCENIVVACMGSTNTMFRRECCGELLRPTMTGLGQCFTSRSPDSDSIVQQKFAGLLGGYKVIFAVNASEQIIYDPKIVSSPSLAEAGIHMSLSSFDLDPSVATSMQAFRLAPHTAASVALSLASLNTRERYAGMWPWSVPVCVTEEKFWNLTELERSRIHHNLFYHAFYRTCPNLLTNCTLLARRFTNDTTAVCYPSDILHHKSMHIKMTECLDNWLHLHKSEDRLCELMELSQQLSYTTLVQELLEAQKGITIIPNLTYSMINVYYTQLGYTEHRENIPTVFTWFSGLGGQMGLFLGASVITLVEIYFTICSVLRILVTTFVTAVYSVVKRCFKLRTAHPA